MSNENANIFSQTLSSIRHALSKEEIFAPIEITNIRYIAFIVVLAIIYIANTHYAERNLRKMSILQKDLKELRWQYMTSTSKLMFQSKQTEIAKLVEETGLKENIEPPKKIVIH